MGVDTFEVNTKCVRTHFAGGHISWLNRALCHRLHANGRNIVPEEIPGLAFTGEEAVLCLTLHAKHGAEMNPAAIIIRSSDTDFMVL